MNRHQSKQGKWYVRVLTDSGQGPLTRPDPLLSKNLILLHFKRTGPSAYLFTYLLITHSMVQDIIWKADCHSTC
jgi:hypothetical protein